jgi:Zn-dependent protease/CBS domain-containing protein
MSAGKARSVPCDFSDASFTHAVRLRRAPRKPRASARCFALPCGTQLEARAIMATTERPHSWWTFNLGRVAGIAIRAHVTLVLLLVWIAISYAVQGAGVAASAVGIALVISVFAVIVVHELGHALVARHYGIGTRDILLLPIGGISSLERMPERPSQELAVALVGPMINIVLAGLLWLGLALTHGTTDLHAASTIGGAIATQLLWINVGLAVFNLIPAFPMDGGRALRALLAMKLGQERATDIAAVLGKCFAIAIGIFGLFYNPLLLLIAVVVWMGATQERALVHLKSALHGVPVSAAMLTRVGAVSPDQRLEDAASLMLSRGQNQVPVVDHGVAVGVLTRSDVASALKHGGPEATVASARPHDVVTVAPGEPLDAVLDRLRQSPDAVAVVVDRGTPVGMITAEALAAYVAMHDETRATPL